MTYVITEPCIGVKDASCVDVCPVDCIHARVDDAMFFIDPDECIDCGACEPECPVTAIFAEDAVPDDQEVRPDQRRLLQAVAGCRAGRSVQRPEDTDAFDAHYRDVHSPIVWRYPNLRTSPLEARRSRWARAGLLPDGRDGLRFGRGARRGPRLEAGAASAKDLRNFAGAGVTMFIAPDEADA